MRRGSFRDPKSDTRTFSRIQDERFFSPEAEEEEEDTFWFLLEEQNAHATLRRRAGQCRAKKLGRRK